MEKYEKSFKKPILGSIKKFVSDYYDAGGAIVCAFAIQDYDNDYSPH